MDTTTKLRELFKKNMSLPSPVSDEAFDNSFHHNLEYLRVRWLPCERRVEFDSPCGQHQVTLLDLFYGQEERLSLIAAELAIYIGVAWDELMEHLVRGARALQQQGAAVGRYVLPRSWSRLLPYDRLDVLFGADVAYSVDETARVESASPFGRFVETPTRAG